LRPARSQPERTRREDRRSKFYEISDNLNDPTVELKVSDSGSRLKFRGPHEHCGTFNPRKKFFPRISGIKIRQDGSFKRSRDYEIKSGGARGEILDLTYVWTVKVSGRFVSAQKAKGRLTYELILRMKHGTESCGRHSGRWTATR
jgi:hypothetical protein